MRASRFENYEPTPLIQFLLALEEAANSNAPLPKFDRALFPGIPEFRDRSVDWDQLLVETMANLWNSRKVNLSVDVIVPKHHALTSRNYFPNDYHDYLDIVSIRLL